MTVGSTKSHSAAKKPVHAAPATKAKTTAKSTSASAKKTTAAKKTTTTAAAKKTTTVKKTTATHAVEVTKKAKKLVEVVDTGVGPLDALKIPSVFPVEDLSSIKTHTSAGAVFRLDGGFLDGLRLQVRRTKDQNGNGGMMIDFKITGPFRDEFTDRLEKKGASTEAFSFLGGEPKKSGSQTVIAFNGTTEALTGSFYTHAKPGTSSQANLSRHLTGKGWKLDYIPSDGPVAMRGYARILLSGSDAEMQKSLKDLLQKTGLHTAFAPTTDNALRRYAMMKLLWRLDPGGALALAKKDNLQSLKLDTLQQKLEALGVSEDRIEGLRYEEVAPGHFTVYDPAAVTEMKKAGLRFAYSTVTTPEHVLSILEHGQKATLTRWSEGALISGMSSMADVGSGGAQGVFSRLVTPAANSSYWTGRTYKIILKPELLGRLDIWGWPGDYFGKSWDLSAANFGPKLLSSVGNTSGGSYASSNEIISPVGNGPKFIAHVVATNESDRAKLINYLKDQGYKPPHGSLNDFVVLRTNIDASLLS